MATVGIRALQQNASAVVAAAAAGEIVTITDRGRPVAQMTPIPSTHVVAAVEAGRARLASRRLMDLPEPEPGSALSKVLEELRDGERY